MNNVTFVLIILAIFIIGGYFAYELDKHLPDGFNSKTHNCTSFESLDNVRDGELWRYTAEYDCTELKDSIYNHCFLCKTWVDK